MKKKIVSVLLAASLVAGLISGCGGVGGSGDSSSDGGEASGETVEISFYTTETGKDEMFQNAISKFEEDNPGITVEYIAAGDDQLQKWMSLYASKEAPTVSLMDPVNIYENQERMRVYDPEECDWLSNIKEDALGTLTYDGKIYGIPYSTAGIGQDYIWRARFPGSALL